MAENRTCQYKGRTYKLLYRGKTKYGSDKAKLAFLDGSKEFWVDGSAITEGAASTSGRGHRAGSSQYPRTGCSCGSREGIIQDTDCFSCVHDA